MDRVREAYDAIRARTDFEPRVGIVLGTGLGRLADDIEPRAVLDYGQIPHFPDPTVESHSGRLILGSLGDTPVVAMQGRFHRYEGHDLKQVTLPIRIMRMLGAEVMVVSAAVGGMNPHWGRGSLVVLDDHINLMGDGPLIGPNLDELGPRFPDMSRPYDPALQDLAIRVAREHDTQLHRGVYVAVVGPNLETRAEYRMLRTMGADVVGMSTVPEVIVARHMGMRVLGIVIVTDECLPDTLEVANVESIIATAREAEPALTAVISGVVAQI